MLCGHAEPRQTLPSVGSVESHNRRMVSKTKRSKRDDDPLAVYRRIRKPMPPPEKVVPDKRRELEDEEARREIEEER
jgi:hypothetical protein